MFLLILLLHEKKRKKHYSLHSTMFLLILGTRYQADRQYQTLHSTMFLLIQGGNEMLRQDFNFTFHNVSINTGVGTTALIHEPLYIPQCFY